MMDSVRLLLTVGPNTFELDSYETWVGVAGYLRDAADGRNTREHWIRHTRGHLYLTHPVTAVAYVHYEGEPDERLEDLLAANAR